MQPIETRFVVCSSLIIAHYHSPRPADVERADGDLCVRLFLGLEGACMSEREREENKAKRESIGICWFLSFFLF